MDKLFSHIVIKTVSEDQREIEGIASTPTIDRVNDIVDPMGLTFQKEAPLLLGHDHAQPVGTVNFGTPTARGLPFRARIAKVDDEGEVKTRCDTAWHSVKSGIIKGVSIGFRPIKKEQLPNGGTRFSKADVHELSLVAVPANPDARITAYKSLNLSEENTMNQDAINQVRKALAMSPMDVALKAAVPAATTADTPGLYYPSQQSGVTPLVPVVTRSLINMLIAMGAPTLPPNVRALVQPAVMEAAEIPEGVMYPAAAPSTDVKLQSNRKFGLIVGFNEELARVGTEEVAAFVLSVLEQAANNATDAAMVASITSAAGAPESTVSAAIRAFSGDIRTAAWIGNPETLATLRSAQETEVGPQGGRYYQLPALPVLAMPNGSLALIDVKRVAAYDGPQFIEQTGEADIAFDSAPTAGMQTQSMFQSNMVAMKVTKYADYSLMVNPVMVTV